MSGQTPGHLYERIAAALRDQILARTLAPGARLPTRDDLAATFGASETTVRLALDLLESEGLINRGRGAAPTVRLYDPLIRRAEQHYKSEPGAPFAEEAIATERVPRYSHETRPDRAGLETAHRLKIGVGDEVMRTDYVSYANDEPMMLTTSYEPLAITRGTPIEKPEEGPLMGAGIVDRFTSIGLRPTAVVERLHSRMPRPSEVEALALKPGIPVIVIVRTSYAGETPIETADILLAAHQYKLEYVTKVAPLGNGEASTT
ncbi:GntR family transcriptional regulator [Amycolatopsis pretoriensis]|uniref:GntR family transcriptional regulator n=1 Tax=Amycolatopsis pretoriensis TaxID=218821 RepID=A0A1H5QVP8_9PSEU|nr:GntR family transcriptional regulator [Amycolatopsis pretoriensis]SEF30183.1 GntR family transcriptional regulator [Amycolatopsis pretoriensis]